MVWPAVISAGASILGGILGGKSDKRARQQNQLQFQESLEQQNFWNQKNLDFATRQFETSAQTRVKDAKAAGLHPLFAMGGSMGGSPSFSTGGHPGRTTETGSALGRGIQRAGQGIAQAMKPKSPLILAELNERAARTDHIREQTRQLKLDEQRANHTRASEQPWDEGPDPKTGVAILKALPRGRLKGRNRDPLPQNRPRRITPTTSASAYSTLVRPDGTKIKIFDKEAQADELNQAYIAYQEILHSIRTTGKKVPQWLYDIAYNRSRDVRYRATRKAWKNKPRTDYSDYMKY